MYLNDPLKKIAIEQRTDSLILEIFRVFPPIYPANIHEAVNQPVGVDGYQMAQLFSGRSWLDLGEERLRIPWEEIVVNLSPVGFYCYLPHFMVSCLRDRFYGWIDDMLLPVGFGMDEVVRHFTMDDENRLDPSCIIYQIEHSRVAYIKEKFNQAQRACIANYVELACTNSYWDLLEHYQEPGSGDLTDVEKNERLFQQMIRRYVGFWLES